MKNKNQETSDSFISELNVSKTNSSGLFASVTSSLEMTSITSIESFNRVSYDETTTFYLETPPTHDSEKGFSILSDLEESRDLQTIFSDISLNVS